VKDLWGEGEKEKARNSGCKKEEILSQTRQNNKLSRERSELGVTSYMRKLIHVVELWTGRKGQALPSKLRGAVRPNTRKQSKPTKRRSKRRTEAGESLSKIEDGQ